MVEPDNKTITELYKERKYDVPWRVFACHICKICWWHPISYCLNCPNKVYRFPKTGYANYAEIAKEFPDYKSGGY